MAKKKRRNPMRKYLAIGAGLIVVGGGAVVLINNKNKSEEKNVINWSFSADINTLDISKTTDVNSGIVIGNSGSNLLRMNKDGKAEPDLAKEVKHSKDGLTYTATLRDGLKYSNGTAIKAEDFVYSWRRIVNPATASEYAYLASGVLNADAITSGKEKDINTLGVKADGDKIIFTLERPVPQFEDLLTFVNFMPQSEKYVKDQGKKYGTTSDDQIYSGPFKVQGWNGTNGQFKMVKNDNYWDAKNVKVPEVTFNVVKQPENTVQEYKQGTLDYAPLGTPDLYNANKNEKGGQAIAEATTAYIQYMQNGSNKALANTKIRQAINLATNRTELVDQVTAGLSKAATGLVPAGLAVTNDGEDLAEYVKQPYTYDKDKAKQLWEEGLKEIGQTSVTLSVLSDADSPVAKTTLEYLSGSWQAALPGLKVEQKFVPFKQRLQDTANHNFDMVVSLWSGDYPEGSTFYSQFPTGASYNAGLFSNPEYDAAYNKAITTDALKTADKDTDYKTAEKALYEQANINPLYWRSRYSLVNPDVKDVIFSSTGLTQDFIHAYKE